MANYSTLQDAVDGLRADNQTLTDKVLASDATATTAKADAEAARVAAELAEANAKQSETLAGQYKDSAEAAVPLAEQHKLDAEAQVPLAQAEKTGAEAARDSAVLTALGPDNDKLASIASVYSQPSLNLDFAKQSFWKQGTYPWNQDTLDPAVDLTFTRASTATYFDADGVMQTAAVDEMRFDHDPVTGEPLGVLIEPEATNFIPFSEDFAEQGYTHQNVDVIPNYSEHFGQTFTLLRPTTDSVSHRIYRSRGGSGLHTATIFAKAAGYRYLELNFSSGSYAAIFDLGEGEVVQNPYPSAGGASASIEHIGGGVYRCHYTNNRASTITVRVRGPENQREFPGDGSSGIEIFGLMDEEGSIATSYIPTSGSPVTRAADSLRIPFAEEYNPKEGTWVWEGLWTPGQNQIFFRGSLSTWNMWGLGTRDGASNRFYYVHRMDGSGPNTDSNRLGIGSTLGTAPRRIVVAGVYKVGGAGEGINRIAVGGEVRSMEHITPEIPVDHSIIQNTSIYPGEVGSVRYYPYAMTEAELIELTALPEEPES